MLSSLDPLAVSSRQLPPEHAGKLVHTWPCGVAPPPIREGEVAGKFGHRFVWSPLHWTRAQLEPWRLKGDCAVDRLIEAVQPGPADDLVEMARLAASSNSHPPKSVPNPLPSPQRREELASWYKEVSTPPAWVDWQQLARGQDVFIANAPAAALALYYLSLVGGFSAPLITRVLRATAYLTAPPKHVMRRLIDTGAMITACVHGGADALKPGGAGWKAALQVRVLHAKVRQRLLARKYWNRKEWGVPINQEDMAAKLLAFSYNVLVGIELVAGSPLPQQEQEDYMALWRYIGWVLGVETRGKLDPCRSVPHAKATLESVIMHLLDPDEHSVAVAHHLLKAPGEGLLQVRHTVVRCVRIRSSSPSVVYK